jgi:hypothetical protein
MARPRVMNAAFGEFVSTVLYRFNLKLEADPAWIPDEGQATVLKRLAETQVILMKGRPLDENGKTLPTARERANALATLEKSGGPEVPPPDAERDLP